MTTAIEDRYIPSVTKFVIASMIIHVALMSTNALIPKMATPPDKKPPIKVKYIEPEKPKEAEKKSTLIDAPKPRKIEKPTSSELIAAHDSRAHSNLNKNKRPEYRRNKTVVPKIPGKARAPSKRKESPKVEKRSPAKTVPEPLKKAKKYPLSDRGFFTQKPKDKKQAKRPKNVTWINLFIATP